MENLGPIEGNSSVINLLRRVMDPAILLIAAIVSYQIILQLWNQQHLVGVTGFAVALSVLLASAVFARYKLYSSWRTRGLFEEVEAVSIAWGSAILVLVLFSYLLQPHFVLPRKWAGIWFLVGWTFLIAYRLVLKSILIALRKNGRNIRRAVIVGHGKNRDLVQRLISEHSESGIVIVASFDDRLTHMDLHERSISAYQGGYREVGSFVKENRIKQVWLATSIAEYSKVAEIQEDLEGSSADIQLVPEFLGMGMVQKSIYCFGGVPVIDLSHTPLRGNNVIVKAMFDRFIALLLLIFFSPVMLAIALLIKFTSPGPVIFRQKRRGCDGAIFAVFKFRTMFVGADGYGTAKQAVRLDPRVTPIGKVLRCTSLDELPQLLNVLGGEMSLVGPRPHPIEQDDVYQSTVSGYLTRHRVRPGITGLAQIKGYRGETNTLEKMQRRVDLDIQYVQKWSLWLDVKILVMTMFRGFYSKNAY